MIRGDAKTKGRTHGWILSAPATLLNHLIRCPLQPYEIKHRAFTDPASTLKNSPQKPGNRTLHRQTGPMSSLPFPLTSSAVNQLSDIPASFPNPEFDIHSVAPSDSISQTAASSASDRSFYLATSGASSSRMLALSSTLSDILRDPFGGSFTGPQLSMANPSVNSQLAHGVPQPPLSMWSSSMQTKFEEQIARLTAAANLPLSWVDNVEWHRLVELFIPGFHSPSRKSLTTCIIPTMVERIHSHVKENVEGNTVTLQADGWTAVNFVHLVAIMLTVSCKVCALYFCYRPINLIKVSAIHSQGS